MDPESLFVVGNELFLENFPQLRLFSCQLFDNLQKAGIFDAITQSITENLLAISQQKIIIGERVTLGKFTLGLARSAVKITHSMSIADLTHMRHCEGPKGWVEFTFVSGKKFRVIMNSRQEELISLVKSHRGGVLANVTPETSQPSKKDECQEEIGEMIAQFDNDGRSSSDNLLEKEEAIKEMMAEYNK
jgi:hypothetical protein